jgi:hypothetical protein
MKVCPICQSTYEDVVDFCFKDGAPLESQGGVDAPEPDIDYALAGITADDLEPPDAISLSNIPAVEPDEDAITQTLPVDLPDAEELDRSYDRLEAIEGPPEHDVTGIVDPFGGHEEEKFRALLADHPDPGGLPDDPSGLPADPSGLPDDAPFMPDDPREEDETGDAADVFETVLPVSEEPEDEDEAAAVVAPPPEKAAKSTKSAPKAAKSTKSRRSSKSAKSSKASKASKSAKSTKPAPKVTPAKSPASVKKATPPPAKAPKPRPPAPERRPRRRPEDFGQPQKKDRKGLIIFLVVLVAIVVVIGWQLTKKPSGDGPVVDASGTPTPSAAVTPRATPEPTPEPVAEETPEDGAPGETEGDGLAEGETPDPAEEITPEEVVEPPAAETDAERRRREERERRRREREEERRRLEAASATPAPTAAPEPTPQPTGAPEPPFSMGGSEPTPRPTVAPSDNPWATTGTPAPTPAPDPSNPWGVSQPTSVEVTVASTPIGARVSVGGRYRGTSPIKVTLDSGTHEVRVEQQGYATQTRYLKVEGGAPLALDVVLEPLVRVVSGTLTVASAPPAKLSIDGVSKGRTPLSVAITAGSHTFKLETDDGRVLNQTLNIELAEGQAINKFFQIPE